MKRFRIFVWLYRGFFFLLYLVLGVLLVITPGDVIVQVRDNNNTINQVRYYVVISGSYGATFVLAGWIYLNRIMSNRSALRDIPKTYIPIGKGEVSKNTRQMIEAGLRRSAAIAWESRPRTGTHTTTIVNEPDTKDGYVGIHEAEPEPPKKGKQKEHTFLHRHRSNTEKDEHMVEIPPYKPVWGEITHNGWSSPTCPDLPNIQYTTVILELPHLIEARAVSMAPPDPGSAPNSPKPDFQAVDILQRPVAMGLRDYISHLTSIGVFTGPANDFLAAYEHARFAPEPITEAEFRSLMALFADLLRNIQPLDPATIASLNLESPESDIDDDASSTSTSRSRSIASAHRPSSRSGSEGTIRTAPSRRAEADGSPTKRPEFSTAPATPRSRKSQKSQTRVPFSRSATMNSFAQSRRPYTGSSGGSSESLRSSSQGSVIRLSNTNESGQLPYTLMIPGV
ncbi:Defect at low temperature 1 [Hyphodiscus hymeniophilus]|uniref:Defect at low temperature protein 1 n=1 Tax=Hyphodiscus hymeniophilus TaxID=353542 RepID=A0A9P7B0Y2_9HELO|nr:Defect at low temperature 1 [Hyphodiscus hymeniophilus]